METNDSSWNERQADLIDIEKKIANLDDEEVEGITSDDAPLENFLSISFHAVQYNGEEIVPYSE